MCASTSHRAVVLELYLHCGQAEHYCLNTEEALAGTAQHCAWLPAETVQCGVLHIHNKLRNTSAPTFTRYNEENSKVLTHTAERQPV